MASPVKIPAIVKSVDKHTDTVVSYTFEPQKRVPKFKPGQFLHIALDEYDPSKEWPESRVFSIASSARNRNEIRITVSVVGSFTKRMYNEIEVGSAVWLKLPYGEFTFNTRENNIVLIAGGTGITPYLSFLEDCLLSRCKTNIQLYYGIREEKYFIFDDLLKRCRQELDNFELILYCEMPCNIEHREKQLDINEIHAESTADAVYYISGPFAMVENFRTELKKFSIENERVMVDTWQ